MTADALKPTTCCGKDDKVCVCAKQATCSCGKTHALHCNCEKAAKENHIEGPRCSCRARPAGECTCDRAATENTNLTKPATSSCACGARPAVSCTCEKAPDADWNPVEHENEIDFTTKNLKYLEDLGLSVVGQGGQSSPHSSTPDVVGKTPTADNSEYTHTTTSTTTWHSFLLSLLKTPYTHILEPSLALLATAFRALYIFLYYLTHNVSFTGRRLTPPEWTLLRDLPIMHLDRAYLFTLLTSPSVLVRDYRRWRRRKGIRFARPKIRTFVEEEEDKRDPDAEYEAEMRNRLKVLKRGGPHLGQENPFDYVSDDEDEWDSEGARERRLWRDLETRQALERRVVEAGLRAERELRWDAGEVDGGGDGRGVEGKGFEVEERVEGKEEEVKLEEHAGRDRDVIAGPKIGRKEAKRGPKKRKNRR
ncbi:hypothetical protein GE09DRAFT_1284084 [Coniochaeta sp. 2T2.1]|nr:hypothetical protein GE09DRAFT_1284084 [Coniochaeta sp. 2T2.1]